MINAKDAAKLSAENGRKKREEIADRRRKTAATRAAKERENRVKFAEELNDDLQDSIHDAIKQGKRLCEFYIGTAATSTMEAQNWYNARGYLDLINRVVNKFRRAGYRVTQKVGSTENTTMRESSVPDYTYYTYHAYLEITW